jgi:EAL domain-containing protein (putative c-di-GMP-specific phosphodiesterase class I)
VTERLLLAQILAPGSLSVKFQPVLDVRTPRAAIHYFEALIRGPWGTSAETPTILFEYARRIRKEAAVDLACLEAILDASPDLPAQAMLGINVHASTLAMDASFVEYLEAAVEAKGLAKRRLVVEIVEHSPPGDLAGLRRALDGLRGMGARIALDDVGLGHSNLMMVLECRPDYLKVDRHFVSGCHQDFHRRAVLASVVELARSFGSRVVAEGVEEPADLAALTQLGITLIQGFLLGIPRRAADCSPEMVPRDRDIVGPLKRSRPRSDVLERCGALAPR